MKRGFIIFLGLLIFASCAKNLDKIIEKDPYTSGTKKLNIQLNYPDDYSYLLNAGTVVKISNPSNGVEYSVPVDNNGKVSIDLQYGLYRVSASEKGEAKSGIVPIFNRNIDQIRITDTIKGEVNVKLDMLLSYSSQLVIKEVYFGGCMGSDNKGYAYDKYIQLYNNSNSIAYLDSLCFGCLESYNAPTTFTSWSYYDAAGQRQIMDTIPIIEAIWQFPGNGKSFPLQPGESTVIALCGAIDHTILHPNSVNLNVPGYFVCYDQRYTNQSYHPSPGANLSGHILDLLWKQGAANAYPFSLISPAPVIFTIRDERGANAYIKDTSNKRKKPGVSSQNEYVMIPSDWVLDGVDVIDAATKYKRFPTSIDASTILFAAAERYKGKTIHRVVDEQATLEAGGRVVYQDTNNSSADFVVKEKQSIK